MDGLEEMVLGDYKHILLLPEVANMDSVVRFIEAIKKLNNLWLGIIWLLTKFSNGGCLCRLHQNTQLDGGGLKRDMTL